MRGDYTGRIVVWWAFFVVWRPVSRTPPRIEGRAPFLPRRHACLPQLPTDGHSRNHGLAAVLVWFTVALMATASTDGSRGRVGRLSSCEAANVRVLPGVAPSHRRNGEQAGTGSCWIKPHDLTVVGNVLGWHRGVGPTGSITVESTAARPQRRSPPLRLGRISHVGASRSMTTHRWRAPCHRTHHEHRCHDPYPAR